MSIKKHDDSVKGARGISGTKGEDFSRRYAQDPWTVEPEGGSERSYTRNNAKNKGDRWAEKPDVSQFGPGGVRRPEDFGFADGSVMSGERRSSRDIFDDVLENDGPHGGFSAAIRAGVNKSQK
jgi:hypothetical protein